MESYEIGILALCKYIDKELSTITTVLLQFWKPNSISVDTVGALCPVSFDLWHTSQSFADKVCIFEAHSVE